MITDLLENLDRYRGLNKNLDTAVEYLRSCDLSALSDGKHEIDGEHVFINVMEADLREAEGALYECHGRYADLQINMIGSEYWEWTDRAEWKEEFSEDTDIGLGEGPMRCGGMLGEGRFVLFLPGEFHKPSCISPVSAHVRKAVVKIEM